MNSLSGGPNDQGEGESKTSQLTRPRHLAANREKFGRDLRIPDDRR